MFRFLIVLGLLLICPQLALAQTSRNPCYLNGQQSTNGIPSCESVSSTKPLPVIIGGSGGAAGTTSNASSGVAPTSTNIPAVAYGYLWNGTSWDQSTGLLTGVPGAPGADVVTVQFPIINGSFPTASTPIQGNGAGTTAAVVGTLAANATKTTYICDFDISAVGGTAAVGPIVVAGLLGGSKTYQLNSAATPITLSKNFNPCLPASAINTAITITTTADGTATAVNINSSGYQQ